MRSIFSRLDNTEPDPLSCNDCFFLDSKGIYRFVDAPHFLHRHYKEEELLNCHYKDCLKKEHLEMVDPLFQAALENGRSSSYIQPDNGFFFIISIVPYYSGGLRPLGIIATCNPISKSTASRLREIGVTLTAPEYPVEDDRMSG